MNVQKEKQFTVWKKLCMVVVLLIAEAMLFQQTAITAFAQGTTTVTASSAKIRKTASTGSEALASVSKNDKLDVLAQTTDSDGYTWYKVYVNGTDTGYIRADLVGDISGSVQTESAETTSAASSNAGEQQSQTKTEFVQVTESEASAGKVLGESVNVRENPSTSASIAGKATGGTEVAITGQATDGSGKVWYQVSYSGVTGFIRSDFLEIIEQAVVEPLVEEEEDLQEPVEEEPATVNKDYELVYEANTEGEEEWFLYDYTRGTKQSLETLLTVARQSQEDEQGALAQLKTFKIIAIVLAGILLALVVVVTILIFKLRDSYEYEYEEEEEGDDEEDAEDEDPEEDEEEEEEPVRRSFSKKASRTSSRVTGSSLEVHQPAKETAPKSDNTWQSRNFLDIDDDMEFEFLDLK